MSEIERPPVPLGKAESVSELLDQIKKWELDNSIVASGFHSRVWYRGHSESSYQLEPGVYRKKFTARAKAVPFRPDADEEVKRLHLEREMLSEFRTAGATFFDPNSIVELYFLAQHHRMPTRLLDWTMNPLAALFFAVGNPPDKDGDLFVMDARELIPPAPTPEPKDYPRNIVTMRHPYVRDAIGMSFWQEHDRKPLILPVRPDNRMGRIAQQSSCFTLHMHRSESTPNSTLARIKVPDACKKSLREELRRLNINQFTIYNDLDYLSEEIKQVWGV
ncbi:MAG: FRG domain-containing protein [Planctomycetaceae bacterium]|nr:FRG domain-containing protein [Planctomycetaceae bacterium]